MPLAHLLAGTDVPVADGTPTGHPYDEGNRFQVALNGCSVTAIRWYRYRTTDVAPIALCIWDTSTSTIVGQVAPSDNGAVGWQETPISPVYLVAGRNYVVGSRQPTGSQGGYFATAQPSDSPISFAGAFYFDNGATTSAMPNTASGRVELSYDAEVTFSDPTTGATTGDVQNALADWFDPSDATKPTSDPKRYPLDVARIPGIGDTLGTLADAASAAGTVAARVAELLIRIPSAITSGPFGSWGDAWQSVMDVWGWFGSSAPAAGTPTLPDSLTGINDDLLRLALWYPLTDTDRWELVNAGSSSAPDVITETADLYRVTITSYPFQMAHFAFPGGTWIPRLGWWAAMKDGGMTQRQFLDFDNNILLLDGKRMGGALIWVPPTVDWSWEAWRIIP